MRILGIDPGTGRLGWAVLEKDRGKEILIAAGCIETLPYTLLEIRLELIFNSLNQVIKDYQPNFASVEDLFFTKNIKTAMSVGAARGVVLLVCQINKIPVSGYTPTQIKSGITGFGAADKKQVIFMVGQILKGQEIPKLDDTVDAIAAALVGLAHSGARIKA